MACVLSWQSEVWLALPYQHPNKTSRETSIRIQTPLGREEEERVRGEEEEEEGEEEEVEEEEQLRRGEVESSRKGSSSSTKNKEAIWQDAQITQDTTVHGQVDGPSDRPNLTKGFAHKYRINRAFHLLQTASYNI